jgi:hypothetical protein
VIRSPILVGVSDANIRPSYMFDDIGGSVRTIPPHSPPGFNRGGAKRKYAGPTGLKPGGGDSIYGTTLTRQQRVRKENQVKVQQTGKPDLSDFLGNWSPLQGEPVCKSR